MTWHKEDEPELLHNNKKQIVIFLDLAKAIDTVYHSKLELYTVRGVANNLFKIYLQGNQYAKIDM